MTDNQNLINALEHIHDWCMSDETEQAVTGRWLKEFYELFDNFEKRECSRGIHRGIVIYGMVHAMGVIAATTALSGALKGQEEHCIDSVAGLFRSVVTDVLDASKNGRVDRDNR